MLDLSDSGRNRRKEEETTRKQDSVSKPSWKELLVSESDCLRPLVEEVIQQVLEQEMEETLQAGKGERTASRQDYRSGYLNRTQVTRVGKLELRVPQDRQGRFRTDVFERYRAARRRWWEHGGDVCAGCIDAQREGDHRSALRT